jgi:hypothetical protein
MVYEFSKAGWINVYVVLWHARENMFENEKRREGNAK